MISLTLLGGILAFIWGISSFILLIKLNNEKTNPDSKVWILIRLEDKSAIIPTFWVGFIVLGIFFGILGFAIIIAEVL